MTMLSLGFPRHAAGARRRDWRRVKSAVRAACSLAILACIMIGIIALRVMVWMPHFTQ